jgi:hypothetical protein
VKLSPVDRRYFYIPVTATLPTGQPTTIDAVNVAVLLRDLLPDRSTAWTQAVWDEGFAVVLLAGPEADQSDAILVPFGGAVAWILESDDPEVQAVRVPGILWVG